MKNKNMNKLMVSGAIAGAVTPFLLKYLVMPVLNFLGGFIPQLSLKLSSPTIIVNIRESLTGLQGGLAGWLIDAFGIAVPENMMMTIITSAVGGALLFMAGGYLAEMLGWLKGNAVQKTRNVIFAGSLVAALVLGTVGLPPELGITLVNLLIAFGINAAILAWLYAQVDSKAKLGLIPF